MRTINQSPERRNNEWENYNLQADFFLLLLVNSSLIGHSATIFLACFTSDSSFVVTGCHDGVLKLWANDLSNIDVERRNVKPERRNVSAVSTVRDGHDMGVTCGECSPVVSELK